MRNLVQGIVKMLLPTDGATIRATFEYLVSFLNLLVWTKWTCLSGWIWSRLVESIKPPIKQDLPRQPRTKGLSQPLTKNNVWCRAGSALTDKLRLHRHISREQRDLSPLLPDNHWDILLRTIMKSIFDVNIGSSLQILHHQDPFGAHAQVKYTRLDDCL